MSAEKEDQNPLLTATLGYKEAMRSEEKLGTTLDGLLEEILNLSKSKNKSMREEALAELLDMLPKYRQAVDNMKIASVAWGQLALNQIPSKTTPEPEPVQSLPDINLNGTQENRDTRPLRPVRAKKIEEPPLDDEATVVGEKAILTLQESNNDSNGLVASLPPNHAQQHEQTVQADQPDISYPDVIFRTVSLGDTQPLTPTATPGKQLSGKLQIINKIRDRFPKIQIKITKRN